ncbi:hypothetical protein BD779DRAFT_1483713 [Infundibulicybe gibba]|nr:hypothetical protein BD779DRAFT_1483713 [Infundibulicybe gibba]
MMFPVLMCHKRLLHPHPLLQPTGARGPSLRQALARHDVDHPHVRSVCLLEDRTSSWSIAVRLPTPTKRKCPPKNCTPLKRPRSESTSPISKKKEAKRPIELEAYEEELTCPMYGDFVAVAHSSNPCGHSFCGDCSWEWVMGKKSDRCPICRTKLCKTNPMIPNVVVDKLVDKHIQLLGSYDDDWTPTGHSHKEWRARIEHWRSRAPERAKVLKPPARRRRRVGVYGVASDDEYVVNMIDIFEGG